MLVVCLISESSSASLIKLMFVKQLGLVSELGLSYEVHREVTFRLYAEGGYCLIGKYRKAIQKLHLMKFNMAAISHQ